MHELLTSWDVHPTYQLDKTNLIQPMSWIGFHGLALEFYFNLLFLFYVVHFNLF